MGSSRRAKQIKRIVRRERNAVVLDFFKEARSWKFWERVKLAWLLIWVKREKE